MTTKERIVSLVRAVHYLERYKIPGALVECGVWRGGSMMAVAKTLLSINSTHRELFLFDTYCGMPDATDLDVDTEGRPASVLLDQARRLPPGERAESHIVAECPVEIVKSNLISTGYPVGNLHFVQGRVEDTIPQQSPDKIALLRLDTDWYESTRHEMACLFPRLSRHGVLIVDDYGYWRGARRAVDEYFEDTTECVFLSRVDSTCRIAVRC